MVQIPEYVPVSRDMTGELLKISNHSVPAKELQDTHDQMMKSALEFLDQIVETPTRPGDDEEERLAPLKQIIDSFDKLTRSQKETRSFYKAFEQTRTMINQKSKTEPHLTLENLNTFNNVDLDRNMFSRVIQKVLDENADTGGAYDSNNDNDDYIYLKNAAFIIDHPLDPLPEEQQGDDDDIQVEGGKIDLKCPISLKIFENPMKSVKCGHTFDLEGISGTWHNRDEQCPILGCGKVLRRTDFKKDDLMNLRVKSYYRLQKKLENNENVERL